MTETPIELRSHRLARRAACVSLLLGSLLSAPLFAQTAQTSVIAVDLYNKKIHLAAAADLKRPVGGLTMIATAMVALDWQEATDVSLNTLATVPADALQIAGSNGLGLSPGDQMTLRDLLYASMMTSDNLAATTLAAFVGQDILMRRRKQGDAIGVFVDEMNKLAAREGCSRTHFTNPHGLENSRTAPYSTAADIAKLTLYALTRAPFKFYTDQKTRDVTVLRNGQPGAIHLENTNLLLGQGTIDGVKTGNTAKSGGCVVITEEHPGTVMKDSASGKDVVFRHRMVVVVLGSSDPFTEAAGALQQSWKYYNDWLEAGRPIKDRKELLPYLY